MSVIDILTRVDAICQKYGRYDAEKLHGSGVAGEDPFARLYASVDADLNECLEVLHCCRLIASLPLSLSRILPQARSGCDLILI